MSWLKLWQRRTSDAGAADALPVHRIGPLPIAPARGRIIVAEHVLDATVVALMAFAGEDGPHEGIVCWAGRVIGADTLVASAVVPRASHGPQGVRVTEANYGDAARAARSIGLGLVAQVHSHPGADTRHSSGDDTMILMPREGMFSIVVGNYGRGSLRLGEGLGVHQLQDGQWVQVEPASGVVIVIPSLLIA